ncbi:hypothetical protein QJS04_geneDACA016699 [Acorus gramineus]|uniref:Remorin C-terminal domain-containing protein n=1 Tax=Acorus gramineus TaxID=55184 RepID=A0AAV9ARU1_ACOGR|nr:hypothetical protein QJS04_geneDACA016699 [Acorus gramineus]
MRSSEDKPCYSHGSENSNSSANSGSFNFHKSRGHPHRTVLGKPTPSKWDDAQKWLAGFGGDADSRHGKASKPRNSNAEDRRLLAHSLSQKARESCSSAEGCLEDIAFAITIQDEGETKKIDCMGWRANEEPRPALRSVFVRDMGTEMTPVASLEPSRTTTPLRASTPVLRSQTSSRSSTPGRVRSQGDGGQTTRGEGESDGQHRKVNNSLESRAMAWDEAERAKYMARYKREEVKIQAWENHEKRKAEVKMKRMEVKAERLKSRAQEKLSNKLAAARRIAEEKRANAEAKLNEQAAKTSERADYIRRTARNDLSSSVCAFDYAFS